MNHRSEPSGRQSLRKTALGLVVIMALLGAARIETRAAIDAFLPPSATGWHLIHADEFDGTTLNSGFWDTCDFQRIGTGCYGNVSGELSFFQPDDVLVQNGNLRLRAQQRNFNDANGGTHHFSSGIVGSANRFNFLYGYLEARIKIPKGRGFWPAFYTLPVNRRANAPEIDVVETLGTDTTTAYLTYHFPDAPPPNHQTQGVYVSPVELSADYHIYSVDWQPGLIVYYIDGVERFRTTDRVTNEIAQIGMFLTVGINWNGNGFTDGSSIFPSYLDVDYVHVWQRGPDSNTIADPLGAFDKVFGVTSGLGPDTGNAGSFRGDATRWARKQGGTQSAIWKMNGMSSFAATAFFWPGEALQHFQFQTSTDGRAFNAFTPGIADLGGDWKQINYTVNPPAGTTYVKVIWPNQATLWAGELASVNVTGNGVVPPTPTTGAPTATPVGPTATPAPGGTSVFDPLNDFTRSFAHTGNLQFFSELPQYFQNDPARLARSVTTGESVTWNLSGMAAFTATAYFWPNAAVGDFTFFASPDNAAFTQVTPSITPRGGDWQRVDYALSLPAGTNFVRVGFPASTQTWSPQLASVGYSTGATGPGFTTVTDDLANLNTISGRSGTQLTIDTQFPGNFAGDGARLMRLSSNAEFVTWTLNGMRTFKATTFFWPSEPVLPFTFATSADGAIFQNATPVATNLGGDWTRIDYGITLPAGHKVVKMSFPANARTWSPQIGSARYTNNPSVTLQALSLNDAPSTMTVPAAWFPSGLNTRVHLPLLAR